MHATTLIYGAIVLAASVNARALDTSLAKRHAFGTAEGTCAVQPYGSGPVTNNPDTADAFLANPIYGKIANKAATPSGYSVQYQGQQWASTATGYLGVEELDSYDVDYCAKQCCSADAWKGCQSFNIYFERNPILDPGVNCTDPASTTRIKCSYWTSVVSTNDVHNDGQYCAGFHVVIAGSNGYKANSCPASTSSTTAAPSTTTTSTPVTTSSSATTTQPAFPSGVCTCADGKGPSSYYAASNGDKYGICIDTDFNGGDLPNGSGTIYSITSDQACADACSSTAGCVAATLHKDASVCYLKGSLQPAVVASGEDSVCKLGPGPFTSTSVTSTSSTTSSSISTTSTKPIVVTTPSTLTTTTKPTTSTKPVTTSKTTSTSCTTTSKGGQPTPPAGGPNPPAGPGPNPPAGPGPNPPAGPGPNPPAGPGPNPPAPSPSPKPDSPLQPWIPLPTITIPQLPKPSNIFGWINWN